MEVKDKKLEKVLVSSEPSEGVLKIAKYDGMRPNETHVSTTRVPHERFGSVYVHHFESDDGTNARHLVSMHHDPHQAGVSILLAARQNENKPMTVYAAATHPDFQGNRLNYVALREAVKSHGTLHSDVMQSMPAFKNWNRLKQESGFKVNITKPYREPSAEDASMLPHIAQYSKQAVRKEGLEKGAKGDWQKEGYKIKYKALPNNEHEITAHTKTGEIVGSAYLLEHSPYEITAADVSVDEGHRRKGLASAMYELAEKKTGKKMVSASEVASQQRGWDEEETFSSDAEKLWSQPKRKFGKSQDMEKAISPEQQKENIKKQRQLKNKEIIAQLKSKVVDKAPAQEPSIQPRLLMSEDESPAGIPIYLKTHPSHDNLTGVHVHVDKLPSLENYGILDEPRIDRALDSAESRGHSAVYVSADQIDKPKKPKLQLVKSKLTKATDKDIKTPVNLQGKQDDEMSKEKLDEMVHFNPKAAAKFYGDKLKDRHIRAIIKNSSDNVLYLTHRLTPRHIDLLIKENPKLVADHLVDKLNDKQFDSLVRTGYQSVIHPLIDKLNEQQVDYVVNSPWIGSDFKTLLIHNPHYLKKYGKQKRINFSSNTEKLRKLRDIAEANNGTIHFKQLAQHGLDENSLKITHLKDSKGNYSAQAIQNHINSLPKHSYGWSEGKWNGAQKHSEKQQEVFQLNITPEIIENLKKEGVFDTFKEAHNIIYSNQHPSRRETLGWVRYNFGLSNDSKDLAYHIDEIQTDFGHNTLNKLAPLIEKKYQNKMIREDKKNKLLQLFTPDKFKKMHNILFSNQAPSKLIHEAFLEHKRNNFGVGREFHIWQAMPKAKIAKQKTEISIPLNEIPRIERAGRLVEQNKPVELEDLDFMTNLALNHEEAQALYNKHSKEGELNKEAYKQDLISHPIFKHVVNHLKGNQDKIEEAKTKGMHGYQVPLNIEHLPVHMKVGYDEVPPKMDYAEAKYGDIEVQENNQFRGQPTWKTTLRKSIAKRLSKALLTKPPQVEYGRYTQPFSMGGTKKEKKTIYSHFSHPEHAKFNAQEHVDAYWRHQEKIKQNPKMEPSLVNFHKQQAQMHWDKSRDLVDKGDTSRRIEENKPS